MEHQKDLINSLKRIYPKFRFYIDGTEDGTNYYPPYDLNWEELIKMLNKNGFTINWITKEKIVENI